MKRTRKKSLTGFERMGSTYRDYRYGERRPVYDPAAKGLILRKAERQAAVEKVARILSAWEVSPFQHEATCRHGIRQSFCTNGHGWQIADAQAADIVREALATLGAQRPTWEEGQRGYVDPRENCAWCTLPIRPEDYGTRGRFCSAHCAKMALEHMDFERSYYETSVGRAAYAIVLRSRKPKKKCAHCRTEFAPLADQKFCSHRCYHEHERQKSVEQECRWCSKPFLSTRSDAFYCSKSCNEQHRQVRSGIWVPKRLSAPVFDFFVARRLVGHHRTQLQPEENYHSNTPVTSSTGNEDPEVSNVYPEQSPLVRCTDGDGQMPQTCGISSLVHRTDGGLQDANLRVGQTQTPPRRVAIEALSKLVHRVRGRQNPDQ